MGEQNGIVDPNGGAYECFHCLHKSVIWDNDFDFEDFGYEGEGIVHCCHCMHCGADVQYMIRFDNEGDK